ncbi:hypothetical protein B4099_1858 [Heyndrickxia coagulans]|uniref:Uncharacterized protein n=1 Tax=Heyndrickxia coagulans TaxID=1398 RepID=A0A150KG68_HEYCO|nr:hypothetical protein B4099_1858 [Heyndrickxia coagulans]
MNRQKLILSNSGKMKKISNGAEKNGASSPSFLFRPGIR